MNKNSSKIHMPGGMLKLRFDWYINFTRRPTEVNFPGADWLSYLRSQLTVFVGGVCLRSKHFFQRCFLATIFSPEGETLKSYNSKGICSIALKFGQ